MRDRESRSEREQRGGGSGSTTGAINSSGGSRYRFNCNYFGITEQGNGGRDDAAISREPRINYPHVKTYYRAHR